MSELDYEIAVACKAADVADAAALFRDYAASLSIDLGYQGFEAELAGLPGAYVPPKGALLLARGRDRERLGCVALRPTAAPHAGEMKRLYVAPSGRGRGLGRALAEAIIATAARAQYREIRLDTLPDMKAAIALYEALGFEPMPAYYATPIAGTRFMRLRLPTS